MLIKCVKKRQEKGRGGAAKKMLRPVQALCYLIREHDEEKKSFNCCASLEFIIYV